MKPAPQIQQIIPAPANLRIVYQDCEADKEFCEPAAGLALVAFDNGKGGIEQDFRVLALSDCGVDFAESCSNFVRFEWSVRKTCKCKA